MKKIIENFVGDHSVYKIRRKEFDWGETIPFRVSPEPFRLNDEQREQVLQIGLDMTSYFLAVDQLYRSQPAVHNLLDRGKPNLFRGNQMRYLFIRPDLIVTPNGFSVCEVETSPFGLALSDLLNAAYHHGGFTTLVGADLLTNYIHSQTPELGTIVFNDKTAAFAGQMNYLAEKVFSGSGRTWQVKHVSEVDTHSNFGPVYRGFYLSDYDADEYVRKLVDASLSGLGTIWPSLTPHMEEKAILSFIWDSAWESILIEKLGNNVFFRLRNVIPQTFVIGESAGASLSSLGNATKSERLYVLKHSGFTGKSSWAESVHFLHKKSRPDVSRLLNESLEDKTALHILQRFTKGSLHEMRFYDGEEVETMSAKIRVTPYYAMTGDDVGKLLTIKATGCENTDLIHASSSSVNTAVS